MILRSINNSRAAHEPFIGASGIGTHFSVLSHSLQETQSSSVTPSGSLWLQTLARLAYEPPRAESQREIEKKEPPLTTQTMLKATQFWAQVLDFAGVHDFMVHSRISKLS